MYASPHLLDSGKSDNLFAFPFNNAAKLLKQSCRGPKKPFSEGGTYNTCPHATPHVGQERVAPLAERHTTRNGEIICALMSLFKRTKTFFTNDFETVRTVHSAACPSAGLHVDSTDMKHCLRGRMMKRTQHLEKEKIEEAIKAYHVEQNSKVGSLDNPY